MPLHRRTLLLTGDLVGVGVDLVGRGRVSERLAQRRFSAEERAIFAGALDIPFAAREALVKAVGGPGMLGAPLREMNVTKRGDDLVLVAGPKYLAVLAERRVDRVWLGVLPMIDTHVVVVALALRGDVETTCEVACSLLSVDEADPSLLTEEERELAAQRPSPRSSIATRHAARLAARAIGGEEIEVSVARGGDDPPSLRGLDACLSLAHEDELAIAFVARSRSRSGILMEDQKQRRDQKQSRFGFRDPCSPCGDERAEPAKYPLLLIPSFLLIFY